MDVLSDDRARGRLGCIHVRRRLFDPGALMTNQCDMPCPFCGGIVDPNGWLNADGERGPECETCGSTASSLTRWNTRHWTPGPAATQAPSNSLSSQLREQADGVRTNSFFIKQESRRRQLEQSATLMVAAAGMLDALDRERSAVAGLAHNLMMQQSSHEPRASAACPICAADSPHSHGPEDICAWLQKQAGRFNLNVEVFDRREHKEHIEYLQSVRGRFREFVEKLGTGRSIDYAWDLWCESPNGKARLTPPPRDVYTIAGWLNRASPYQFCDIAPLPTTPGNWEPVYLRSALTKEVGR